MAYKGLLGSLSAHICQIVICYMDLENSSIEMFDLKTSCNGTEISKAISTPNLHFNKKQFSKGNRRH